MNYIALFLKQSLHEGNESLAENIINSKRRQNIMIN